MKYSMYCIRDIKTDQFSNPMTLVNDGHAIRTVSDFMSQEGNNQFASHPSDFELYRVGEFDSDSGAIAGQMPKSVVLLSELVKK